jgi:hypothetical protein
MTTPKSTELFTVVKAIYEDLNDDQNKQIKRLLRTSTGERFVTAQKSDPIYLAYDKKSRLVGYSMLSSYSPEKHFKVEGPYLYNFITDTSLVKEKRCGRFLLAYIENDLAASGYKLLNLDVECDNIRAFKFFAFNKYRTIGKYEKLDLRNMNLHDVDKAIRANSLQEKIDEIKQRRGLKTSTDDIVSMDDTPNKKIVYMSMTKLLGGSVR